MKRRSFLKFLGLAPAAPVVAHVAPALSAMTAPVIAPVAAPAVAAAVFAGAIATMYTVSVSESPIRFRALDTRFGE